MGKLRKSFSREASRRTVNWLQDIFHLDIVSSRNHSTEECENDIKLIVKHLAGYESSKSEEFENFKQQNQSLNRKIGTLENKLKLSEENSDKYSTELEKNMLENKNYKNTIGKIKELYQEEHEELLKLIAKKWWQVWK
ncbi:hypothetical protein [Fusobacterium sp. IOR10]|uniref:hypothetical protein n=1 Tax=Fusobacterium sp. IOR10 TaxID=2665157 RepID=UPI0013D04BA7|nr:hypothetical protein [Fusobacterium sp. IOR10]